MTHRAANLAPEDAAVEAVKAYLRMHRARVADDLELMALLLPERFGGQANVADSQRYVIERLLGEMTALKAERDGLRHASDRAALTREGVRRLVLDLIDARNFEQTIAVATGAAATLDVDQVSLGVESAAALQIRLPGMCLLPPGLADKLVERDWAGSLLRGTLHPHLFADGGKDLKSVAVFRLRIGPNTPPALFAVGSKMLDRFDDDSETREIGYFVRALERIIRAWLDLPTG